MATVGNGVYIQDINGRYWTEDMWDGSVEPNGIAVITDECSFVMALTESSEIEMYHKGYDSSLDIYLEIYNYNEALNDFMGYDNTKHIEDAYGDSYIANVAYAYGYCLRYDFPRNNTAYLGSAGEWYIVSKNVWNINSLISLVGGDPILVGMSSYWTSSRSDDIPYDSESDEGPYNAFWVYNFIDWSINSYAANQSKKIYARPFTTLN